MKPALLTKVASKLISWYVRRSPIQKGKYALWQVAAAKFLVAEVWPGVWMRSSGLTEAEMTLFRGDPKEPKSVRFASRLLRPGMVVFDVGANVGYYSLLFATHVGPHGQVHAFEPTPMLAARVRLNAGLNQLANIRVNELAVGSVSGTASLNLSSEDPEANSLFKLDPGRGELQVAIQTLDEYAATVGVQRIDFLKVDCEGSELRVLEGAARILSRPDAPVILLECNATSLAQSGATIFELCNYLRSAGYQLFCLEQLRPEPSPVWNVVGIKHPIPEILNLLEQLELRGFPTHVMEASVSIPAVE